MHSRTISIENSYNAYVDFVHSVIIHEQRLGDALTLVVTSSRTNRIDVATIGFRLRVNFWIAVNFRRTRQQDSGTAALGHSQHVDRSQYAGLDRLDWIELVMTWGSGASHMIDLVDFQENRQGHVVSDQFEIRFAKQMDNVRLLAGEKVVQATQLGDRSPMSILLLSRALRKKSVL